MPPLYRPAGVSTAFVRFGSAFRGREFRYLWLSDSAVSCSEQMEFLVLAWFILQETDSPFLLGVYAALRFTGTLFSPLYGIVVDRYRRERLLSAVRFGFTISSFVILVLAIMDVLDVWHVFVLVGVSGMGRAFDTVTRQTVIPDIVPREGIMNAVALTRSGRDVTQIIGPIVGGVLLNRYGISWSYLAIVAMYFMGAVLAVRLRIPNHQPQDRGSESMLVNLRQAFAYVRAREVVLGLLLLAFLVNLTGFPLNNGLLPVYAKNVLQVGAEGLGQLLAAYSAGSMIGSITIAALPRLRRPGAIMSLASIAWHGGILTLTLVIWFGPAMATLALTGLAQSFTMVTMSMLLLSVTSPEIRGRVMGLRSLAVYGLPLGLLASGFLADILGAPLALAINGIAGIAFGIAIVATMRSVWRYSWK